MVKWSKEEVGVVYGLETIRRAIDTKSGKRGS
jgi:hypothetical protein